MKVFVGSEAEGSRLKDVVKQELVLAGYDVEDCSDASQVDFVDATLSVVRAIQAHEGSLGFAFDGYGVGSYMTATRVKGMVAAVISDERSAYMTREHNNARLVCMGSKVVGDEVAKRIAHEFLSASYAAGRHQIRVDMLNKMA